MDELNISCRRLSGGTEDYDSCLLSDVDLSSRGFEFLDVNDLNLWQPALGEIRCRACNWREVSLFGGDLSSAVFVSSDLTGAVFEYTDLNGTSFAGSILSGASFIEIDERGLDFSGALFSLRNPPSIRLKFERESPIAERVERFVQLGAQPCVRGGEFSMINGNLVNDAGQIMCPDIPFPGPQFGG
ncbi:MAG: pentapeptide repeat-containing protein [Devosiaceae bacterium]|nr:pentapeptide repeat-containing protein [Devosiaceae bacterium MH13]